MSAELLRTIATFVVLNLIQMHAAIALGIANDGDLDTSYASSSAFPGEGFIKNPNASVNQVGQILLNADHSALLAGSGFDSGNDGISIVANVNASGTPIQGNYCHNAALSCTLTGDYSFVQAFPLPGSPTFLLVAGAHEMSGNTADFGFQSVDPTFNQSTPPLTVNHAYPLGLSGDLQMVASAVQTDGKYIFVSARTVGSNTAIIVTRALTNLDVDSNFGTNGSVGISPAAIEIGKNYSYAPAALAIAPDGKILIAATTTGDITASPRAIGVFRLNSDGTFDTTFGPTNNGRVGFDFTNGIVANQQSKANALALRDDGSILVGGSVHTTSSGGAEHFYATLTRLHADGSRGDTFGPNNITTVSDNSSTLTDGSTILLHYHGADQSIGDTVEAISIQPNGRILVAGLATVSGLASQFFGIARFERNGDPDLTFGNLTGTPGEPTRYYSYLCGQGPTPDQIDRRCNTPHDLARTITSDSAGIYVAGYSNDATNDIGFSYIRLVNKDIIFANNFATLPPGG